METRYAIIRFEGPIMDTGCSICGGIYPRQPSPEVARLSAYQDALVVEPICWDCAAQEAPLLQDMVELTRKAIDVAFEHFAEAKAN